MAFNGDSILVIAAIIGAIGSLSGWGAFYWQRQEGKKRDPNIQIEGGAKMNLIGPEGKENRIEVRVQLLNIGEVPTSIKSISFYCGPNKLESNVTRGTKLPYKLEPHVPLSWGDQFRNVSQARIGDNIICRIKHSSSKKPEEFNLEIV